MRRGEIRVVEFNPGRGSEASKRRPAVIVSNDGANAVAARLGRGVITVLPITSNIRRIYPFQVRLLAAAICVIHFLMRGRARRLIATAR